MLKIAVVDVETTGLPALRGGRVIEVGVVVLEKGAVIAEMDTLINAGASITFGAYRVHGISEDMLKDQPLPADVWAAFRDFVGSAALVAHNAPFDSTFVRHELALLGFEHTNCWQCTVQLARRKLRQLPNHRLDTVYRHLFGDIPSTVRRHRALDDARMAARIWVELEGA